MALNTRALLHDLAILFGYGCIEPSLAWYMSAGLISLKNGAAFADLVRESVSKISPQALNLVDAFDIPEHLLNAPIAQNWAKYNEGDNQGLIA